MIYVISLRDSLVHMKRNVKEYNDKQVLPDGKTDYTKVLRPAHVNLLSEMIRMHAYQVNRRKIDVYEQLPPLVTNNVHLSEVVFCSEKTIYNHLQRLEEAGFIYKVFRGHKFAYNIHFTPLSEVNYHMETQGELRKIMAETAIKEAKNEVLATFTPEVSCQSEATAPLPENEKFTAYNNTRNFINNLLIAKGASVERHSTNESSNSNKKPINKKQGGQESKIMEVYNMSVILWQYCLARFYAGKVRYIAPAQVIHAQTYFMQHLLTAPDLQKAYQDVYYRLQLVDKYVNNPKNGQKKYIPLPTAYFNDHKKGSFAQTTIWSEKIKQGTEKYVQSMKRAEAELKLYGIWRNTIDNLYINKFSDWSQYKQVAEKLQNITPSGNMRRALDKAVLEFQNQ